MKGVFNRNVKIIIKINEIKSKRDSIKLTNSEHWPGPSHNERRECPKCLRAGKMVKYEAPDGNIVECVECGAEFDEADFKSIKDPSAILSLKEKQGFLRPFLNE